MGYELFILGWLALVIKSLIVFGWYSPVQKWTIHCWLQESYAMYNNKIIMKTCKRDLPPKVHFWLPVSVDYGRFTLLEEWIHDPWTLG